MRSVGEPVPRARPTGPRFPCLLTTGPAGVQYIPHKENNNKYGDDYTRKIADKDITEEDVHHPQITSPTEWLIYSLRPRKPRNHPRADNYSHAKIVHYTMTQYLLRKGINKFKKVGKEAEEKELNQPRMKSTFAPMNVEIMSKK